jgi:hypothetical protein
MKECEYEYETVTEALVKWFTQKHTKNNKDTSMPK